MSADMACKICSLLQDLLAVISALPSTATLFFPFGVLPPDLREFAVGNAFHVASRGYI